MRIAILHGRVIDPVARTDRIEPIYLADGLVAAVGDAPAGFRADRTIEASGLVVAPGLIDLNARLREPGQEHKATLDSELRAAVAGGVTRLACPPDTDPPLDEPGLVEMLTRRARHANRAHVHPVGALTSGLEGAALAEMGELADAGCVAYSQGDAPLPEALVILRAMQYASTFRHRVWLRPQDASLARGGVAHDGEIATRLGLPAVPACAETVALATILALARETGVSVHLQRLSTAEGVAMVRDAKRAGLAVTAEVAAHHLHLCDVDLGWFDAQARFDPPLRGTRDRAALRAGLADGTIDVVSSDHAPVDDDAKQVPFGEAEPGATGLELLLSLTLKWASEERIALPDALARVTRAPAAILGVAAGRIAPGAIADLCIFDPSAYWRVERRALASQGKNTPFLGHELPGRVRWTLVRGEVVHEAG
ncbi:MAG TPA: dihydroorotase [Casimicrobiaceae bacterium]|nr:dihydroorotase [Casimicrobiaceae bacterium]